MVRRIGDHRVGCLVARGRAHSRAFHEGGVGTPQLGGLPHTLVELEVHLAGALYPVAELGMRRRIVK